MSDMIVVCARACVPHIRSHSPKQWGSRHTLNYNMTYPLVHPPRGATVAVIVVGGVVWLLDRVVIRQCQSTTTITIIHKDTAMSRESHVDTALKHTFYATWNTRWLHVIWNTWWHMNYMMMTHESHDDELHDDGTWITWWWHMNYTNTRFRFESFVRSRARGVSLLVSWEMCLAWNPARTEKITYYLRTSNTVHAWIEHFQ